jgi:UDP-3-O-acyl-N-acetylglucosamine deacetylase
MVSHGLTQIMIFPDPEQLSISCVTSFKGCPFDPQFYEYVLNKDTYGAEIAPGRTFVDYKDLKMLLGMGLVKGGSLECAVVMHEGAIISKEGLRHPNEFVRHKMMDLVGDIYLVGARVKAKVTAVKAGHPSHVKLAQMMLAQSNPV